MRVYAIALTTAAVSALIFTAGAPATRTSGRVIRFIEVEKASSDVFLDVDQNDQPSVGDSIMTNPTLYAWAKGGGRGAHIGHARVQCTFEGRSPNNPEGVRGAFCQGTFFFHGGTVGAEGYVNFSDEKVTVPVVGGTGAYEGARGTFSSRTTHDTSAGSVSADIIRLLP